MTVGGLVDTVFRFNRLCECHLYTAPRNMLGLTCREHTSSLGFEAYIKHRRQTANRPSVKL
jgi:hypothetical protein